jgi:hypothetical protein
MSSILYEELIGDKLNSLFQKFIDKHVCVPEPKAFIKGLKRKKLKYFNEMLEGELDTGRSIRDTSDTVRRGHCTRRRMTSVGWYKEMADMRRGVVV